MNKNKINFYKKTKKDLQKEFFFVSGVKNRMFDLMCYGFSADTFVKIVPPEERNSKSFYIKYVVNTFEKTLTKKLYLMIDVDRYYNEISRELLEIN